MDLRSVLANAEVTRLTQPVDPQFELPAVLVQDQTHPTLLSTIEGYPDVRVLANVLSTREGIASALSIDAEDIATTIRAAMNRPTALEATGEALFEHIAHTPTIDDHLPIPTFYPKQQRQYFASSIVIARDPDTQVPNLSFHRMMYLGDNRCSMRIVERHLYDIIERTSGDTEIAVVMGVHPAVELAAATSIDPDESELAMANALLDGDLAVTELDGLPLPAHAEIVMRGRITDETAEEGPFVDLSRTWDDIRQQPVVEIDDLYLREDPLVRVIVPGRREHAHLMGLPQEPRMHRIVQNTVSTVESVVLTPGGCSWLHAVVQLRQRAAGEAKNAGLAALAAHPSLKKVTVVDADIDPTDPDQLEWAEATRMQPANDITVIEGAHGSSLDPSRDPATETTSKWVVDATKPVDVDPAAYEEVTIPGADDISLQEYR